MTLTSTPTQWEQMYEIPIAERIGLAPEELIQTAAHFYRASGYEASPRSADVSADLVADLREALGGLPQVIKDQLASRLLGVFFMAGLDCFAATDFVTYANGEVLGAVVLINVDVFADLSANKWATWRENTAFQPSEDFKIDVRIASSQCDCRSEALQFILLHEFGHVMAAFSNEMPDCWSNSDISELTDLKSFPLLSWTVNPSGVVPAQGQDFPLRSSLALYSAEGLPADVCLEVYDSLSKTNFPTIGSSTNMHEDFAESYATYAHSVLLGKPYEVRVRHGDEEVFYANFWNTQNGESKSAFFEDYFARPATTFPRRAQHVATAALCRELIARSTGEFLGLAPFLRLSIEGGDLRHLAQELLARANLDRDNSFLWMNMATAFFSLPDRPLGLAMQGQGLSGRRQFHLPSSQGRVECRVLMLVAPGDLAENIPLDCLLEGAPIELNLAFCTPDAPLPDNLPEHDVLIVGMSDTADTRPTLEQLQHLLAGWERPIVNLPKFIPNVERMAASRILQGVPGLYMPLTHEIDRIALESVSAGSVLLQSIHDDCAFPIILRPRGSHAGRGLQKIDDLASLKNYLEAQTESQFYISPFIDYSGEDGQFRKIRVAMIDGQPFVGHMAISSHWMIHYVNAGMYVDRSKADEEAAFMDHFDEFSTRHHVALQGMFSRIGLDYLCVDCAETRDGQLLIFEVDHAMVIHGMDPVDLFPYKQVHMHKVRDAFVQYLRELKAKQLQAA